MILGTITATCLTYLDCTDHKTTDVLGVDNVRSKCHLLQNLNYTIRYVQKVIKYTPIKLYDQDIYHESMFIEQVNQSGDKNQLSVPIIGHKTVGYYLE